MSATTGKALRIAAYIEERGDGDATADFLLELLNPYGTRFGPVMDAVTLRDIFEGGLALRQAKASLSRAPSGRLIKSVADNA